MRIDLLLEREPFSDTLIETLSAYLTNKVDWSGKIEWDENKGPFHSEPYCVLPRLNLIAANSLSAEKIYPLAREYGYHKNPFKKKLQSLYVKYCVDKRFRSYMSSAFLAITPLPYECRGWCILGGNHTVRIIDTIKKRCIVLQKKGFDGKKFENTILHRRENTMLPGPQIFEHSIEYGWYEEELINGLPINRLHDDFLVCETLERAMSQLGKLYEKTKRTEKVSDWLTDISNKINSQIEVLPAVYDEAFRSRVRGLLDRLTMQLGKLSHDRECIETAITHGDFQQANILLNETGANRKLLIIDWEYVRRRYVYYDVYVYAYGSRNPTDLSQRLSRQNQMEDLLTKVSLPGINSPNEERTSLLKCILEDFSFRLEDTTVPDLKYQQKGMLCFVNEIEKWAC